MFLPVQQLDKGSSGGKTSESKTSKRKLFVAGSATPSTCSSGEEKSTEKPTEKPAGMCIIYLADYLTSEESIQNPQYVTKWYIQ